MFDSISLAVKLHFTALADLSTYKLWRLVEKTFSEWPLVTRKRLPAAWEEARTMLNGSWLFVRNSQGLDMRSLSLSTLISCIPGHHIYWASPSRTPLAIAAGVRNEMTVAAAAVVEASSAGAPILQGVPQLATQANRVSTARVPNTLAGCAGSSTRPQLLRTGAKKNKVWIDEFAARESSQRYEPVSYAADEDPDQVAVRIYSTQLPTLCNRSDVAFSHG